MKKIFTFIPQSIATFNIATMIVEYKIQASKMDNGQFNELLEKSNWSEIEEIIFKEFGIHIYLYNLPVNFGEFTGNIKIDGKNDFLNDENFDDSTFIGLVPINQKTFVKNIKSRKIIKILTKIRDFLESIEVESIDITALFSGGHGPEIEAVFPIMLG